MSVKNFIFLKEIWLKVNDNPYAMIYEGRTKTFNHTPLEVGDQITYHMIWLNEDAIVHNIEAKLYINGQLVGHVTGGDVAPNTEFHAWIPPSGAFTVEGPFKVKAEIYVDGNYYKTTEIEWTGQEGVLREYTQRPSNLVALGIIVASIIGLGLFFLLFKKKGH